MSVYDTKKKTSCTHGTIDTKTRLTTFTMLFVFPRLVGNNLKQNIGGVKVAEV